MKRGENMFYAKLQASVKAMTEEYAVIPEDRKRELGRIAGYVQQRVDHGETANLIFICTHNSRRSHLAQIWAQTAATFYRIPGVRTYSGGTETTAFNPRAVDALMRIGFDIVKASEAKNPVYHVRFHQNATAMTAFSKVYSDPPNPKQGYCAVMTCTQADAACPAVIGASVRVAIAYEDPKVADNTPIEAEKYDERVWQIGREMLYCFSLIRKD